MRIFSNYQDEYIKRYNKEKGTAFKSEKEAKSEAPAKTESNVSNLPRYFQKKGLTAFSSETQAIANKLKDGQIYGNGFKWFNTLATGAKNDGTAFKVSFLNDLVDQNFALLHELDQHKQQNNRIISQNDEIITLLKEIANK
ncbi:hypothetical protein BUY27_08735 [Staphylococcus cohnii]|nr:hypothetical protein BUY27_08735 [Staphylococcus cohnii]